MKQLLTNVFSSLYTGTHSVSLVSLKGEGEWKRELGCRILEFASIRDHPTKRRRNCPSRATKLMSQYFVAGFDPRTS